MSPMLQKAGEPSFDELPDNFMKLQTQLMMLSPIHYKKDYKMAVRIASELSSRKALTKVQANYFESLVNNIMAYENKKLEMKNGEPIEILRFLLEENGLNGSDLGRILGQRQLGSKILNGTRALSLKHIKTLSAYFSVSPNLFLSS